MGSRIEWVHALLRAVSFGGIMFIVQRWLAPVMSPLGQGKNLKDTIVESIFSGLLFGLILTFGLRLLQWPLSILSMIFAVALLSTRLLLRRRGHV